MCNGNGLLFKRLQQCAHISSRCRRSSTPCVGLSLFNPNPNPDQTKGIILFFCVMGKEYSSHNISSQQLLQRKMSKVLRAIDSNVVAPSSNNTLHTPEKSLRQEGFQANKSAKKYRAADLLDIALKYERSGDKSLALSAYEDAAENISNNTKILAKIEVLKAQIEEDFLAEKVN